MEQQKTGGGEIKTVLVLTDLEERLLNLMGKIALEGDKSIEELGFKNVIFFKT